MLNIMMTFDSEYCRKTPTTWTECGQGQNISPLATGRLPEWDYLAPSRRSKRAARLNWRADDVLRGGAAANS